MKKYLAMLLMVSTLFMVGCDSDDEPSRKKSRKSDDEQIVREDDYFDEDTASMARADEYYEEEYEIIDEDIASMARADEYYEEETYYDSDYYDYYGDSYPYENVYSPNDYGKNLTFNRENIKSVVRKYVDYCDYDCDLIMVIDSQVEGENIYGEKSIYLKAKYMVSGVVKNHYNKYIGFRAYEDTFILFNDDINYGVYGEMIDAGEAVIDYIEQNGIESYKFLELYEVYDDCYIYVNFNFTTDGEIGSKKYYFYNPFTNIVSETKY